SSDGHHAFRVHHIHSINPIIHKMYAPIRHQSACIIPKPSEVEMESVFIEGAGRSRSKPHVIIYSFRHGGIGFDGDRLHPTLIRPYFYNTNLSECSRSDI